MVVMEENNVDMLFRAPRASPIPMSAWKSLQCVNNCVLTHTQATIVPAGKDMGWMTTLITALIK
jgi:hypothetical protein